MEVVLEWDNKTISWNKFYGGKHFFTRMKLKKEWSEFFAILLLQHKKVEFKTFGISIYHNTRIDTDNICCGKFLVDYMKENGWCIDDNKKYYKSYFCAIDESLPKGRTKLIISGDV